MANRKAVITETEIARTLRAATRSGVALGKMVVDHATGKVSIYPAGATEPTDDQGPNPCDRLL